MLRLPDPVIPEMLTPPSSLTTVQDTVFDVPSALKSVTVQLSVTGSLPLVTLAGLALNET